MVRKLATIQVIKTIAPIANADKIELATVLGWQVVIHKGEFKVGDKCVYIEIDSVLPAKPQYEFMKERKYVVRIAKFKKVESFGLVIPVPKSIWFPFIGRDVTTLLGIKKHLTPAELAEIAHAKKHKWDWLKFKLNKQRKRGNGSFPRKYIKQTDEERIQNHPYVFEIYPNEKVYVTEKIDGTSCTFLWIKKEFYICSRTVRIASKNQQTFFKQGRNEYWEVAEKYNLANVLKDSKLAIQGEMIGDGIQGNKYGLQELRLYVFNIFDYESKRYFPYDEMKAFCDQHGLLVVPKVYEGEMPAKNVQEMVDFSRGESVLAKIPREGIVVRSLEPKFIPELGRFSFKAINPDFQMKFLSKNDSF